METGDRSNLTIFHIRRWMFGPDRFHTLNAHSRNAYRHAQLAHGMEGLHRPPACEKPHRLPPEPRESPKHDVWPYDTAFPSGLPKVDTFPGQRLSDMPSRGAVLGKMVRSDNKLFISTQPPLTSSKPLAADLGNLIDVFA